MPVSLTHRGRTVRLKWHKLRRAPGDVPFLRRNLRAGLAAGASLEVDVQRLACGRWVCLHDELLEGETTGRGPVAEADAEAVGAVRMRGGDEPPMMLEELAALVRQGPCAPGARVQLDLKAAAGEVDGRCVAVMAAALEGVTDRFILSGCDWEAVTRLGADLGGLALGYDPGDDLEAGGDVFRLVRERAPEAETIYLHRRLVRAAHEGGEPLVARLQERGHLVDCWTIDHGSAEATRDLLAAISAGCDQITTNSAALWAAATLDEGGSRCA